MEDTKNKDINSVLSKTKGLPGYTQEDQKLVSKLLETYLKKRKPNSKTELLAAAILWQYSKLNYLWENDKRWSLQYLSATFGVKSKTVSQITSEIARVLRIQLWDERFCRRAISNSNPLKEMAVTEEGFIMSKDSVMQASIPFSPLMMTKEDLYYEGCDLIDEDLNEAKKCFNKALEIDDEFVNAYNGLAGLYFWERPKKAKDYYQKAIDLSLQHFNGKWPDELPWAVLENRQYLNAIQGHATILWREGKKENAMGLYKLLLKLNRYDNQGARVLVAAIYKGMTWEQFSEMEDKAEQSGNYAEEENLFREQNKIYKFF